MPKPVLIVVNGLPGSGKTTIARRLADDVALPVFSRDGMFETLYDALDCRSTGLSPLVGPAAFTLLYYAAGSVLAAGQPVIIEAFFGRAQLRSAEIVHLRRTADFEPLQIFCKADGEVLLERFLARMNSDERHAGHQDMEWLEQHREQLIQGRLLPLAIGGSIVEVDTTTPDRFDYTALLRRVRAAI